ncbi:MAG: hypothetical protein JJU20_06280 [Opitutales bacterium]|nr:hypothetical protein [Opitutales bacterium]
MTIPLCALSAFLFPVFSSAQISMDGIREAARSYTESMEEEGLASQAIEKVRELAGSFGWRDQQQTRVVAEALSSLNAGESLDALKHMERLEGLRLTSKQKTLFKEAKSLVDVYVLKEELEGSAPQGALTRTMELIQNGSYKEAVPELLLLKEQAQLSEEQEAAMEDLIRQYQEWSEEES